MFIATTLPICRRQSCKGRANRRSRNLLTFSGSPKRSGRNFDYLRANFSNQPKQKRGTPPRDFRAMRRGLWAASSITSIDDAFFLEQLRRV